MKPKGVWLTVRDEQRSVREREETSKATAKNKACNGHVGYSRLKSHTTEKRRKRRDRENNNKGEPKANKESEIEV